MTSEYSDVYSRFYLRVKDYEFAGMDEELVNEMLNGYMLSTLSKPMVRKLFSSLVINDDYEEIDYELREPLDDAADKDFVEEIIAIGMVAEWASPRYHSTLLTSQLFSNSEQKYYSQAAHLNEMKELYQKAQIDLRKVIRDRGFANAAINGVET